jgi:UDP-N-acetylglucosamine 4-epimerase
MNELALFTEEVMAVNQIYNTAVGERTSLNQLVDYLQSELSLIDPKIREIKIIHGPKREGDIPHSLACIDKAKNMLGYSPTHNLHQGLKESVQWYWRLFRDNK